MHVVRGGKQDAFAAKTLEVKRMVINQALLFTNNDKAKAARLLKIGRKTLYRKLEQYKKQ